MKNVNIPVGLSQFWKTNKGHTRLDIQLKEYKSNTGSLANHFLHLLKKKKKDLKESLSQIASLSKSKWKKLLQKKLVQLNNQYCTKKSIDLSKLTTSSKYKKEPKREYIKSLTWSEASIIFKLRTRMLNLKNNFRNNTNWDILCPRCYKEIDNEQHLFEQCNQLV